MWNVVPNFWTQEYYEQNANVSNLVKEIWAILDQIEVCNNTDRAYITDIYWNYAVWVTNWQSWHYIESLEWFRDELIQSYDQILKQGKRQQDAQQKKDFMNAFKIIR